MSNREYKSKSDVGIEGRGRGSNDMVNQFCSAISDSNGKDKKDFCIYGFGELEKGNVDVF